MDWFKKAIKNYLDNEDKPAVVEVMMQSWADYLDQLREGADVIPIRSKA